MNKEKLTNFLGDYAEKLRSDMDWSEVAPCYHEISMPGRCARVKDKNDDVICTFYTKGMPCSCPVSSRDIQGAELLANVINFMAKFTS